MVRHVTTRTVATTAFANRAIQERTAKQVRQADGYTFKVYFHTLLSVEGLQPFFSVWIKAMSILRLN